MKIFIAYNTIDGPYGGANQFFGSLKKEFTKKDILVSKPEEADVILFNSHTVGGKKGNGLAIITRLKYHFPDKVFIHRVDGPISMYRGDSAYSFVDKSIYDLNNALADGTVFQSEWSRQTNVDMGMQQTPFATTILNAPDSDIFYPSPNKKDFSSRKTKIIASSFSNHKNKGFPVYQWLDENLDFSRYEMTFVGNSPTQFKNITHVPAVDPHELANLLREHDIYIAASQKDPCSNALIEALHCGLPSIALRDGGHTEIVQQGGELFDKKEEIPGLLKQITTNYEQYCANIHLPPIGEIATRYQVFAERITNDVQAGKYHPKRLSLMQYLARYIYYRVSKVFRIIKNKVTQR